jgi:archaellum biogenesis ATPase FlaH
LTVSEKERRLESTVAAIQRKHGASAVHRGADRHDLPFAIATGFPQLDRITGCNGVPLGAITLISGPGTSGKGSLAYKLLANALGVVVLFDLVQVAEAEYLYRCGIDLARLRVVRPAREEETTPLLLDVVQSKQVRCVVVDGLPELTANRRLEQQFHGALARLRQLARTNNCAVVILAESAPWWHRWLDLDAMATTRQNAALHVDLHHERWLYRNNELVGYEAQARVLRSLWRSGTPAATIAFEFNGVIKARPTW